MIGPIELGTIRYAVSLHKQVGSSHYRIFIHATMVDEDIQNKTIKIQIPNVSNQNTSAPVTKYKDLKQIEHVFSLQGKIYNQQALIAGATADTAPNTWLIASQAKNALITYILYSSGNINLYWRAVMKDGVNASTSYSNLMDTDYTTRHATTILDKVKFSDPAVTKYKSYATTGVPAYTYTEYSPEYFNFNMTLTRVQQFTG